MSHVRFALALGWVGGGGVEVERVGASIAHGDLLAFVTNEDGAPESLGELGAPLVLAWSPELTPAQVLEGLEELAAWVRRGGAEWLRNGAPDLGWLARHAPSPATGARAARRRREFAGDLAADVASDRTVRGRLPASSG
jgi:hypothetical protein